MENKDYYSIFDGKYQVIDLIEDRLIALKYSTYKPQNPIVYSNYSNLLKYACRWHQKNGVQDLKKLIDYANCIIEQYEQKDALEESRVHKHEPYVFKHTEKGPY